MRNRRNNWEILQDLISESSDRVEKLEADKTKLKDLQNTIWNATNVTGKLQELIDLKER